MSNIDDTLRCGGDRLVTYHTKSWWRWFKSIPRLSITLISLIGKATDRFREYWFESGIKAGVAIQKSHWRQVASCSLLLSRNLTKRRVVIGRIDGWKPIPINRSFERLKVLLYQKPITRPQAGRVGVCELQLGVCPCGFESHLAVRFIASWRKRWVL